MPRWFQHTNGRRIIGSLFLFVGSTLFTLLILELTLQILVGLPPIDSTFRLTQSTYYKRDDYLGWRPQPNVRGVHNKERFFESTFSTNSQGLRGKEIPKERRSDEVRVLLLGDSFTWGYGVNDDQTFAARLEQFLRGVRVINFGVTAFGLEQEYRYLLSEGLNYHPDLILVNISPNDIEDYDSTRDRSEGFSIPVPPSSPDPGASVFLKVKRFAAKKSALYNFLIARINSSRPLVNLLVRVGIKSDLAGYDVLDSDLRPYLRAYPPSLQQGLEHAYDILVKIKQLADSHNIPFAMALIPSREQVDPLALTLSLSYTHFQEEDVEMEKLDRLLREFATAHGITFLSALEEFRRDSGKNGRLLYFAYGDPHFSPEGHALYARVLAQWIAIHS